MWRCISESVHAAPAWISLQYCDFFHSLKLQNEQSRRNQNLIYSDFSSLLDYVRAKILPSSDHKGSSILFCKLFVWFFGESHPPMRSRCGFQDTKTESVKGLQNICTFSMVHQSCISRCWASFFTSSVRCEAWTWRIRWTLWSLKYSRKCIRSVLKVSLICHREPEWDVQWKPASLVLCTLSFAFCQEKQRKSRPCCSYRR